jgi:Cytochrome P460
MKRIVLLVLAAGAAAGVIASTSPEIVRAEEQPASPIFGVKVPDGYRQWELIAPSQSPTELKGIVGNETAMKAYRGGKLPFPEGSILVKLSWKREPLARFDGDFTPGRPTMVQVMVKDSKKYAETGGWGFGRFIDGKPADEAQHKTCFACHSKNAQVRETDFVFTRLAR